MPNPTIRIHNAETDEVIDRPMTDEEFADFNELVTNHAIKEQEALDKAAEKEALLEKLGITADEAKLLLG